VKSFVIIEENEEAIIGKTTITKSQSLFRQVVAGYNHSIALMTTDLVTEIAKVYTWGYSGYNILGR